MRANAAGTVKACAERIELYVEGPDEEGTERGGPHVDAATPVVAPKPLASANVEGAPDADDVVAVAPVERELRWYLYRCS